VICAAKDMAQDVETHAASPAATSQPPAGRLAPGTQLSGARFTVQSFVRRSPFAEVYQGVDEETGDPVSIHLVRAELAAHQPIATAILSRADAVCAAVHRNIIRTLEVGRADEGLYAVTELLDGHPVRDLLARKQRTGSTGFGARGTANIVGGVLAALDELHPALAHGSIGPDSVYVNKAGRVKLVDLALGLAVPAAAHNHIIEAPPGLAPEDASSGQPSAAGDIFAVGRLVYELLVGRPLVRGGPRPSEVEQLHGSVDELVARCCAPNPSTRPPGAAALREAMTEALKKKPEPRPSQGPSLAQALSSPSLRLPAVDADELAGGSSPAVPAPALADGEEKWLISKGKLDYGPFSLAAVVEEIRSDQIVPGHVIVDKDTGERCKVEDHPLLGEEVDKAKQLRDDRRRAQAEHVTVQKESRRGVALFAFIGVGVLAVAALVYFLVMGRQKAPFAPKVVASVANGSTQWEYAVVVIKGEGEGRVASEKRVISNGASTLSEDKNNTITWPEVAGAEEYVVYRTAAGGEPSSTGVIARVGPDTLEFIDDGQEGDGSSVAEGMGSLEQGQLVAKLTFPEPPKRAASSKKRRRRGGRRGSSGGAADNSPGGFDFGSEGGEEILDQSRINPVIQKNGRRLARCLLSKGASRADIEFVIQRTGRVSKVTVEGANSDATSCIKSVVRSMKFPSFDGNYTIARFDMSL
jgi:serine/threonine protein kinase